MKGNGSEIFHRRFAFGTALDPPPFTHSRDVLLNLVVEGCELIMELQLHFKNILEMKEENHRTYELLSTLGWEKVRRPVS